MGRVERDVSNSSDGDERGGLYADVGCATRDVIPVAAAAVFVCGVGITLAVVLVVRIVRVVSAVSAEQGRG